MVVPDLAQICEIMLIAEGFQASKVLAGKFVLLYKLCEDLLSKVGRHCELTAAFTPRCVDRVIDQARHYDWKLRAIKTTLYVAGNMKRAAPELTEEKVQILSVMLMMQHVVKCRSNIGQHMLRITQHRSCCARCVISTLASLLQMTAASFLDCLMISSLGFLTQFPKLWTLTSTPRSVVWHTCRGNTPCTQT